MRKTARVLPLLAILSAVLFTGDIAAQRPRRPRAVAKPTNLVNLLPPSDAVINVDVRRLFAEGVPGVFAGDSAKLAQVNSQIEKFKSQTGVDPRAFDQLAIGFRFASPSPGVTKVESLVLARGKFNPAGIVSAGRAAAKDKFVDQKYKGATIYVFTLNEQMRLFGFFNVRISDVAVAVFDANTLAIGTPANVRAAIDARESHRNVSAELAGLALSDPTAIIGFGGTVTPELFTDLKFDSDTVAKQLSSIRQVYGSFGIKGASFTVLAVARTGNPAQAKELSETVTSILPLAPLLAGNLPEAKKKLAQSALDNLKVVTQGNELRITTEVPQANLAAVIR